MNEDKFASSLTRIGHSDQRFQLLGLLSRFTNRYQAVADRFYKDVSWKQYFALLCIARFEVPPTIKALSEQMGSTHQNVKQLLIKLEKTGFVTIETDSVDKRKQRVMLTSKAIDFRENTRESAATRIDELFQHTNPSDLDATIRTLIRLDEQLSSIQEADD